MSSTDIPHSSQAPVPPGHPEQRSSSPGPGPAPGTSSASPVRRFLASGQPYAVAGFRVVAGGLFACHGAASLFGVLGGAAGGQGGTVPVFSWPGWYAAVIQLSCGLLVLAGLGTRPAALLASGSMAYAYFAVHQPEALWPLQNGGEPSALFCWAFLLLVFTGPGAFALDRLRSTADGGPHLRRTPDAG